MVKVNNIDIPIYRIDTFNTFKERIYSTFNTLEQFVYFPVLPTLKEIKDNPELKLYFDDLLANIDKYETSSFDVFLQNTKFIDKLNLPKDVQVYFFKDSSIQKSLKDEINKQKLRSNLQTSIARSFDKVDINVQATPFELQKYKIKLFSEFSQSYSMDKIFDLLNVSEDVPFISFKSYYKVFQFFPIESFEENSWLIPVENKILMKFKINDNFSDIFLFIDKNILYFEIFISRDVSIDTFVIPKLQNLFQEKIIIQQDLQQLVNGVFYIPKQQMNRYIFMDMILNNPVFSYFLSVDESLKASKQKQSLYVYFRDRNLPDFGTASINITEKIFDRYDPFMKNKDKSLFPESSAYIRVKLVRCLNENVANYIKDVFLKLFSLYNNSKNEIGLIYKKFIPTFEIEPILELPSRVLRLKDIEPLLFLPDYMRKCQPIQPTMIEKDKIGEWEEKGFQVLMFPTLENEIDHAEQRFYVCNDEVYKYPGLTKNTMKNSDKFKCLPCCYRVDQRNKNKYLECLNKEQEEKPQSQQQNVIITDKLVLFDQIGILPLSINNIFLLSNFSNEYFRKGVYRTVNSFLQCILEALNYENFLTLPTKNLKLENIEKVRLKLSEQPLELCKQSMYDKDLNNIQQYLRDNTKYFDPMLVLSLCEYFFDCNIYLFARNDAFPQGTIVLPRYVNGYYTYLSEKKSIFIYTHGFDTEYPQSELIVRKKENEEDINDYFYKSDEPITKTIKYMNLNRFVFYKGNTKLEPIVPLTMEIKGQYINKYGKTTMIKVEYRNKQFPIFTESIPPLPVKEVQLYSDPLELNILRDFVDEYKININGKYKNNTEVSLIIGNVKGFVRVIDASELDVPIYEFSNIIVPLDKMSIYEKYQQSEQYARYILELSLHSLSTYLNQNELELPLKNDQLQKFVEETFIIDENYKYEAIGENLIELKQIRVPNKETLKRLIYSLSLQLHQNEENVISYYKQKFMYNYYKFIYDFSQFPNQLIFENKVSLMGWIESLNYGDRANIFRDILIGELRPYFFKNNLIDSNIYLAVTTQDKLSRALYIGKTWHEDNYLDTEGYVEEDIEFTLYIYRNQNNIKPMRVVGNQNPWDIKIIGYKVEALTTYTVLLRLK